MNRTGLVCDPLYIQHDPGPGHPESPERLQAIYAQLAEEELDARCIAVPARPASQAEICRTHSQQYFQRIAASEGQQVMLDPDTATSADSFSAAMLAAGELLALTEEVVAGRLDNGYALVRPPGHHAERDRAMGFCLFNNVAVAAEHALAQLELERVLIIDWDLHHGNGTMHSFYDRKEVLYFSTHQYPYYPGTGALDDVGVGGGLGRTINVPLAPGMGDLEYRAIFRQLLGPVARQFAPELILVSTGFDTHRHDPLGGMKMTAAGYGALTWELMQMAQEICGGKLVMVLEGGYDLGGLARGVAQSVRTLLGESEPEASPTETGQAGAILKAAQAVQARFWSF